MEKTHVRPQLNDEIKKLKNDGLSEDLSKAYEDEVQELTDSFIAKVDTLIAAKEKDIMTV